MTVTLVQVLTLQQSCPAMFKMDTWLKRVLLAVLVSLHFLCFGRQILLLINAIFLHLIVVEDLNRECFFFKLHSFCIFLIFLPKKTLTSTKNFKLFFWWFQLPIAFLKLLWECFHWLHSFPHHQALCTLLSLSPFTLYLLKPSFLRRLLLLTRVMMKMRTLRNFSWRPKRKMRRQHCYILECSRSP